MRFDKYQAAGNDFIIINRLGSGDEDYNYLALRLCDRHFGIGADGLMVVKESNIGDIKMLYYNSDGSQGEMCGNGIRCFSKYIYDNEIVRKKDLAIETLDGIKHIVLNRDRDENIIDIEVDMGYPQFHHSKIPIVIEKEEILEEKIQIDGEEYVFSALRVGVPHTVIFAEDIKQIDIDSIGEKIENHSLFPEKTNVNFVEILDRENIKIYTWERGAGRTLACGTGSCSTLVVGNKLNKLNSVVSVETEGGKIKVELDQDYNIKMIGDAVHIARGEFLDIKNQMGVN